MNRWYPHQLNLVDSGDEKFSVITNEYGRLEIAMISSDLSKIEIIEDLDILDEESAINGLIANDPNRCNCCGGFIND